MCKSLEARKSLVCVNRKKSMVEKKKKKSMVEAQRGDIWGIRLER